MQIMYQFQYEKNYHLLLDKLEQYKVIILSGHTSGIVNTVASLSGLDTILNNNESSNIFFSAGVSIFLITVLLLGNIF